MKVTKVVEVKPQYSFEAPVFHAKLRDRIKDRLEMVDESLDLSNLLVPIPRNTYLVRVSGESMIDKNIFSGDILVVDRNEQPRDGKIVVAALNGEMAVKEYREINGKVYLYSANKKFLPIEISPFWQFQVQGVVKHVIHDL